MNFRKIRLGSLEEISSGGIKSFVVEGEGGVAVTRAGERLYAFEDRCSHDDGELASGQVVEGAPLRGASGDARPVRDGSPAGLEVECPRHGGRFDAVSGRATRMPAIAPIKTYAVEVLDGHIWVRVPEVTHES